MKRKIIMEIWETTKMVAFAIIVSLFLKSNVVASVNVTTGSMETTVMTGSYVILNRTAYWAQDPQRGDIVSFIFPDDGKTNYFKRVMGLPGEVIEGIDGVIYIDGMPLEHDYTDIVFEGDFGPFEIPENSYFMMGDNRNNSWDSRYWTNKFVKKEEILGKAVFEYYPTVKVLK